MNNQEILARVDHTLLSPTAKWEDIQKLCEEAIALKTASVCVPPCYVKRIKATYGSRLCICTVIGFPLGYAASEAKAAEARQAIAEGADELDMVVNLTDVKNGDFGAVTKEISLLKQIAGEKILKVIIETCYLTEEEKIKLCLAVTEANADFIKTSTGFGTAGATLDDIRLFKQHIGENVKIKAAGGIRKAEDLEAFINEGCARLGTSSAVKLLQGKKVSLY